MEAEFDDLFDFYKTRPKLITNLVCEQLVINGPQRPADGVYFIIYSRVLVLEVLLSLMIVIMLGFEEQAIIKLLTLDLGLYITYAFSDWQDFCYH